jgi:hypothetical protein
MDIDHPNREIELDPDLMALEHRLAAWRPSAGALDRDRMLYDAGRAAALAGSRIRSWRLATAALALISVGLGGLLAQQRSLLARERSLLAQERSQRHAPETARSARPGASEPSPPAPSPAAESPAIEPPSPTSYFALTSRLARSAGDPSSLDVEIEPEPHRPAGDHSVILPYPVPLRPQDIQRVLDL